MGTYLNPGTEQFQKTVNSNIYIDKTEMIAYTNSILNTEQCYVSVSRPRRFGKSIAANMLCAYYGKVDSRGLFEKSRLASHDNWDKYLNSFDVIKVVMTDFIKEKMDVDVSLKKMQKLIVRDLKRQYPDVDYFDTNDLIQSLEDVYAETGKPFVIIIDEWDAVFRERKKDQDGQTLYLDFLRDWLKDKRYIVLAYMTGILPIKKYGKHSALNMFDEYSIISPMQFAEYTGFTEKEVRQLCVEYHMQYGEISDWYDGYEICTSIPVELRDKYRMGEYEGKTISIYCPLSVVNAMSSGIIQNYWNKTESYEALAEYIRMNYDGLKDAVVLMMDGGSVKVDTGTYQNDMTTFYSRDDVLALLIHLGYLKYNSDTKEVSIPNKEILDEFRNSTKSEDWTGT